MVGLRAYQDSKADVILKYTAEEARDLKAHNQLPAGAKINDGGGDDEGDDFDEAAGAYEFVDAPEDALPTGAGAGAGGDVDPDFGAVIDIDTI